MSICNVKIILGRLPDQIVGQWIEVRITLDGNPGLELQADICRLLGNGVFSLESITQRVEEPFTAELALALVAIIAEPPFAPTRTGLDIEVSGDPKLANGEIGRFAFPEVRQDALELLLPLLLRESMLKKLRDAYKKRGLREYVSSDLLKVPSIGRGSPDPAITPRKSAYNLECTGFALNRLGAGPPKTQETKMAKKTHHQLVMERKAMMHKKIAEQGQKQPLAIPNRNNRSMKVSVGWDPYFDWNAEFEKLDSGNFSPGGKGSQVPYIQSKLFSILKDAERQSLNGFVIIGRSGQHFMQCLCRDTGWILEKRVGSEREHWRAEIRPAVEPSHTSDSASARILRPVSHPLLQLTIDQVAEAMGAYLINDPDPAWLHWEWIEV